MRETGMTSFILRGGILIMPVRSLHGPNFKSHLRKVTEYPGGNSVHTGSINAGDRAGIDQPTVLAIDSNLPADMRSVAVSVADQIIVSGAGESLSVMRHMGNEYPAPTELEHSFLPVVSKQPARFFHHAVQRCDVTDVIAMDCMDREASFERGTQCVDADQIATVNDRLRAARLCRQNRRRQ